MSQEKTILIVDDDSDIRENMRDILVDMGYHVDVASDGPSALELVAKQAYDVALLDYKMPDMNGATLYSEIRKVCPQTVAIMVTAFSGSDGVAEAQRAGTWKVLRKPVDIATLLRLIGDVVNEPVVLVVDDDDDFCENLWHLLRDRNYRVAIAHNEHDGIDEARDGKYDVAIVDLRLGAGDGRRVIEKIREANPAAKVISVTAFRDELDLQDTNADVIHTKPVDVARLLGSIEASLPGDV